MPLPTGYTQSKDNPSTYTRPLSLSEAPMVYAITAPRPFAREPVRIHIFADIQIPTSPSRAVTNLRAAWGALRMLHEPDIAATFNAETMEKVYEVVDSTSDDFQHWLDQTFLVSTKGETIEDVMRWEQQRTELLPVCRIVPTKGTNVEDSTSSSFSATILLLFSHWRTEASGVYMLLDRLLTLTTDLLSPTSGPEGRTSTAIRLQDAKPGSELALLTPAPESMAGVPSTTPDEIKTRIRKRIDAHAAKLPSIEIPAIAPPTAPIGPVNVHRLVFSADSTTAFLKSCKAAATSVTGACLAAWTLSIWPLLPSSNSTKHFASMMPAQIRTRLSRPGTEIYKTMGCWNAAQFLLLSSPPPPHPPSPAAFSSSSTDEQIQPGSGHGPSFVDRARDLTHQASLANDPQWLSEEYVESAVQLNDLLAKIPAGEGAAPWFTSLGDLERAALLKREYEYATTSGEGGAQQQQQQQQQSTSKTGNKITVREVYGWADPVGMGMVLTVWTWRGRMNWQVQWNGAYHARAMVKGVLEGMMQRMGELGSAGQGQGEGLLVVEEEVENEY